MFQTLAVTFHLVVRILASAQSPWVTKLLPEQPQSFAAPCSLQFNFSFLHSFLVLMNIFNTEVLLFFICLSFYILG